MIFLNFPEKISRLAAKQASLTRYFSGVPCPKGHVAERYVHDYRCVSCSAEGRRLYRTRHPEKIKAEKTAYRRRKGIPPLIRKAARAWGPQKPIGPYKTPEEKRAKNRAYSSAHKEIIRAKRARRRAAQRQAIPPWLSTSHKKEILGFYTKAVEATEQTGILWEVDHIVPLQGKTVCGLHVPWNLQLLTQRDNGIKRNHFHEET